MIKYVIDRFEGNFAVCETPERKMVNVPRRLLPESAREGMAVLFNGQRYVSDPDVSASEQIRDKMARLWETDR